MPIDAGIYGNSQVQPSNPLQTLAQVYALRGAQQNQAINQQELELRRQQIQSQIEQRDTAVAKAQQDAADREAKKQEDADLSAYLSSGQTIEPDKVYEITRLHPERGTTILNGLEAYKKVLSGNLKDANTTTAQLIGGVIDSPPDLQQSHWTLARNAGIAAGADPSTIPEKFDLGFAKYLQRAALSSKEQFEADKPKFQEFAGDRTILQTNVQPGQKPEVVMTTPTEPPKPFTEADFVLSRFGPNATAAQKLLGHAQWATSGASSTLNYSPDDVKLTVQGMKSGDLPPLLPGRASPAYNAIMAESQRQGFKLAVAATDWMATQTHVKTLNNDQQTRLRQSIETLPHILDTVQTLADKWNGGQFPLLNKANLAAAKNGVYGSEVASVAQQLDAQIADAAADLGNVYMGGNSPTDYALRLAQTSLGGSWDRKVLTDMISLARQNVQTRANSLKNVGVAGASEDNLYAQPSPGVTPPAVPAPVVPRVNPF